MKLARLEKEIEKGFSFPSKKENRALMIIYKPVKGKVKTVESLVDLSWPGNQWEYIFGMVKYTLKKLEEDGKKV